MFALVRENIKIALGSIKSQLLRTILTVFIIAIGIWALVGILGFLNALEGNLSQNFASMGANTFKFQRYESTTRRSRERVKINPVISYRQVKEFSEKFNFAGAQTALSFIGTGSAEVKFESKKTDPEVSVLGINEFFLQNSGLELQKGRDFNPFDISSNTRVCILGSDFKKNLFKNINPIGKQISIRGTKFKIVGLLEEKGSTFGNRQDLRVLIPLGVARSIYTQPNINYDLSVMVENAEYMSASQDEGIITMRKIRGLAPVEKNNFGITSSEDLMQKAAENTAALNVAAVVISALTIFGSCIALLNIMLVSVTERTREIGVRKALGAKKSTIAMQFLYESIIVGQFGGIVGILLGIGTAALIAWQLDFDFSMPWNAVIGATIICFTVAIVSGLFPALKAAKLDPVESLRYE